MRDRWVILLGGNILNAGLIEVTNALGCKLCVVDWNESPAVVGDLHLRLDIRDVAAILEALRSLRGEIFLAYTSADVAAETVAQINTSVGLGRPAAEALSRTVSKASMNAAWAGAGLLGKDYRVCPDIRALSAFCSSRARPTIVKPVASSGSRGVTVLPAVTTQLAVGTAFARADQCGTGVLAEDFVGGQEYTVEMLGDSLGNVRAYGVSKKHHTAHAGDNKVAVKLHYNPIEVRDEELDEIAAFGAQCYRALGLTTSIAHFEVLRSHDGRLVPVEMAARSSGFIASHLLDALAEDMAEKFLLDWRQVLAGGSVENGRRRTPNASMYFFYDVPPGVAFADAPGLSRYLPPTIRSVFGLCTALRAGRRFRNIDGDGERYGHEILVGPRAALTLDAVTQAERAHLAAFMVAAAGFDWQAGVNALVRAWSPERVRLAFARLAKATGPTLEVQVGGAPLLFVPASDPIAQFGEVVGKCTR